METDRVILGIDPGTQVMGFGIIHITKGSVKLVDCGVLKLKAKDDHYTKLSEIFDYTVELIKTHKPDDFAIEAPFFGKNVQSMLKLGRAQGVAIAAAINCRIPVFEYSPKKIKQSITGNGNSSKEQVSSMLAHIVGGMIKPVMLDASDGLAAAVCHYFQRNAPTTSVRHNSWESFLAANPEKKV